MKRLFNICIVAVTSMIITFLFFKIVRQLKIDKLFFGQRLNDYFSHRLRLNKLFPIKGKVLLIVGTGQGNDLESWASFYPKKIYACDVVSYKSHWSVLAKKIKEKYGVEVKFIESDMQAVKVHLTDEIDIIGSDGVFEHTKNFDASILNFKDILKKGGVIYATFGPIWFAPGGDMLLHKKSLKDSYSHVTLDCSCEEYIERCASIFPGNMYFSQGYFSYLSIQQYLNLLNNNFTKSYISGLISVHAIRFAFLYPSRFRRLLKIYKLQDLVIDTLSIVYTKD